jgi:tripartite-type tricarboxylate transporter receptor subunit TctC
MKTIALRRFVMLMSLAKVAGAQSKSYPAKPIRWIVPFPPAAASTFSRLVSAKLADNLVSRL